MEDKVESVVSLKSSPKMTLVRSVRACAAAAILSYLNLVGNGKAGTIKGTGRVGRFLDLNRQTCRIWLDMAGDFLCGEIKCFLAVSCSSA
jgi:hypothetical protein